MYTRKKSGDEEDEELGDELDLGFGWIDTQLSLKKALTQQSRKAVEIYGHHVFRNPVKNTNH